jgi:hypothetical protein
MYGSGKFPDASGCFYECAVAQVIAAHNVGRALDTNLSVKFRDGSSVRVFERE